MARATPGRTPSTPKSQLPLLNISTPKGTKTLLSNGMSHFRQNLEHHIKEQIEDEDSILNKTSPTLQRLRLTPGRVLRDKQTLINKHAEVKKKVDELNVGGGVAIWPEMEKMRLSQRDTVQIIVVAIVLFCTVLAAFNKVHGDVITRLMQFYTRLKKFHQTYTIELHTQTDFHVTLLAWHQNYRLLLNEVHQSFDVSKLPLTYSLYILSYIFGMGTLVYYLYDNMFAKNKLSPRRIRRWVCLLVVIGTWTLGLSYLLIISYMLEMSVQINVHQLREVLGEAISRLDLDKTDLYNVILYWNNRCLPPVTTGTLSILGLVAVQDVMCYLQYYSLPIITVLFTPIVKLIVSLYSVYNFKKD